MQGYKMNLKGKWISYLLPVFILYMLLNAGCNRSKQQDGNHSISYLMSHLTMKNKVNLLGGIVMSTSPVPKLGIPSMRMDDGPLGARWGRSTSFPSGIAMAATWDTAIVRKVGQGIGREVRGKGRNIILGPNVNIARNPKNGRTFEGFGEDPFLTSAMGVSYIKGVQEEGVGATVKHFVANSQEFHRFTIDENINERTLREIYFPAFKAALHKAHSDAIMAAYNKINGHFSAANYFLLNTILRKEWGYKGLIMSDWGAVHSTLPTVHNGLDLEMPTGRYLNQKTLMPAIQSGTVSDSTINAKVKNILNTEFKLGVLPKLKHPQKLDKSLINAPETKHTALKTAQEAIVLLKNDHHELPLSPSKLKSIAVIGPNAAFARAVGGGSAEVHPIISVSPLQALKHNLKGKAAIHYAPGILFDYMQPVDSAAFYQPDGKTQGLKAEYFNSPDFMGTPVVRTAGQIDYRQGAGEETPIVENNFKGAFSVRWTGKIKAPVTGDYQFQLTSGAPTTFYLNNKKAESPAHKGRFGRNRYTLTAHLIAGNMYDLKVEYHGKGYNPNIGYGLSAQLSWKQPKTASISNAVNAAKHSDIAIVFAGTSAHYEHEGADRKSLALPDHQDKLIQQVVKANPHTIVVLTSGAPVLVDKWIKQTPAVLETWFDGEEIGNAITNVLLGNYNPSGKLPVTFPRSWSQEPKSIQNYTHNDSLLTYSEGLEVGYRYFDTNKIKPAFPFGFGLSYTSFKYSDLKVENQSSNGTPKVDVSFKITNTGQLAGAEVAQLYVHENNPRLSRPYKALKKFSRVELKPGDAKIVHITLNKDAFHYFNPNQHKWVIDHNTFDLLIGSSSTDIHLKKSIKL